jgi:hypothetical protein
VFYLQPIRVLLEEIIKNDSLKIALAGFAIDLKETGVQ